MVINNLMLQWMGNTATHGGYQLVTFPIAMNTIYACFVCPHLGAHSMVYWADFGYNVSITTLEIRCCNNDNVLIIGI